MAIKALKERGEGASSIARTLGVTEGAVRYHVRRQASGAVDGRRGKPHRAAAWHDKITSWLQAQAAGPINVVALHEWLRDEHGVECEVNVTQLPDRLPDEVQIALFRVVQEGLTNVARHAGATSASVLVAARDERLRVVVEDDGKGFDASAPTTRLGLAGIRERVELLGGELRIESAPGAGTAVIVDLVVRGD